ncbi:MBL fold metallo-hydrolase [Desulfosporosinus sp. SYSU MS00001]|uniref:MBL fold metallo-hydrolase n=1 Tax=Desulfosporosinus sp. SYSU MS00001 TaxID=3416284 RepID=UPI003CF4DD4B
MGNKLIEVLSGLTTHSQEVTPGIVLLEFTIVNACLIQINNSSTGNWVLVDTGLENSADYIIQTAEKYFGKDNPPKAIFLTHGHFDHVGSVKKLAALWDVPVYIHSLELPYITGKKDYPMGDPTVDEGLVAKMSPGFPHSGIDITSHAAALPSGGKLPFVPDWIWIPTPGHTEGHVSLFRKKDGIMIVGDAFTTLRQESLLSMFTQKEQIGGPPKYFTFDWKTAETSLKTLRDLNPSLAIPSHGQPMHGTELRHHLEFLANHFKEIALPEDESFASLR